MRIISQGSSMTLITVIMMVRQICAQLDEATYTRIITEASKRSITLKGALAYCNEYYSNDNHRGSNDIILREQLRLKEGVIRDLEKSLNHNDSNEKLLREQLQLREEKIQDLERSLEWTGKAYEFLATRALPEPKQKKSSWDKILRRNEATSQN
jgi:hypothetical protein